jgi:hypothetical protein
VIELLLAAGADVDAEDAEDRTPLHIAARQGSVPPVVRRLLSEGADADAESAPEDGAPQTPLRLAAAHGRSVEIFRMLIDASGAPCAADANGRPALDYAERNPALVNSDPYWMLHDRCATAD